MGARSKELQEFRRQRKNEKFAEQWTNLKSCSGEVYYKFKNEVVLCEITKMDPENKALASVKFHSPRRVGKKTSNCHEVPTGRLSVEDPRLLAEPASPVPSPALGRRRFLTAQEILDRRRRRLTSAEVVLGRLLEEIIRLQ